MSQSKRSKRIRPSLVIFGLLLAVAVFLLIPFVFKGETRAPLVAPGLAEVEYVDISFKNGELDLAGMLIVPEGEGPFPTAVIIHGSGTSSRDSKWYLTVAKHLQEEGVAVLLPDKRGSEKSEGDWRTATFEELAGDTLGAIEFIKTQDHFDYTTIGVVGMSQGGWIAPIVATKSDDVAFVVSMAGAGVTTEEQLYHEEIHNIQQMGTYPFVARLIAPITTRRIQQMDFWKPTAGYDPIPYWEQVEAPCFAALGENDMNVPVEESVARFESLESEMLIKIYPDGGHGITDPMTGEVQDAFLQDLVQFISGSTA